LNLALAEADLVLCPSTATFRDCERAGFEVTRLEVVPFGVDVAPATEAEIAAVRRRYGLDRGYVLFVGTIEPGKNLAGLIAAFGTLEHPVDLVVGGPRGWNQENDGRAGDSHPGVKRLGFVPPEHLGPLYAGAQVFCLPSFMEGFGFPVLEAMAQGTPVVTSRGTSTEELAGGAGVLVDPHDAGSIAEGLRSVLDDEDRARELGELGRARAATFTWERTARLMEAAYAKVAA
jgi:glycosyltransferase involved in cell wall biosynthesis